MRTISIVLLAILALQQPTRADTIDYWTVYYNTTRLKNFNEFDKQGSITIRAADVKATDSLTIIYNTDTPCSDCPTTVAIENGKHRVIISGRGVGTRNPVKLSVWALLQYQQPDKRGEYIVFYHEGPPVSRHQRVLLFRIILE